MLGLGPEHRWDHPFPRTGCNLLCTSESSKDGAAMTNRRRIAGADRGW